MRTSECSACKHPLYGSVPGAHAVFCSRRGALSPTRARTLLTGYHVTIEAASGGGVRIGPESDAWIHHVRNAFSALRLSGFVVRRDPGGETFTARPKVTT